MKKLTDFIALKGKTLTKVNLEPWCSEVEFQTTDGACFKMYHETECCEKVYIAEVVGDLDDLLGSPILEAEEVVFEAADDSCPEHPSWGPMDYEDFSYTWTFYKLGTDKGHVVLRWLGESNGGYSERVDFYQTKMGA